MKLHIEILKKSYKNLSRQNPSFSLNAFAHFLKLSPSQLNEILSEKCGLSPERAAKIARKLPLAESEKKIFVLSVKAHHSRRKSDRLEYKKELEIELSTPTHKIKTEQFNFISNWYIMAVLELSAFEDFKFESSWISKKLSITKEEAIEAIECLKTLKFFEKVNGKYQRKRGFLKSSQDVANEAIKNFHNQILDKARNSLAKDKIKDREFNSGLFTIKEEELPILKEEIRNFMSYIIKKYSKNKKDKENLVCLSSQLFSLSKFKK